MAMEHVEPTQTTVSTGSRLYPKASEDNYDPRDLANILPASKVQMEEMNIAMLEQQIRCIQDAISKRENECRHQIIEHYKCELSRLQCSLQAILDHRTKQ